MTRLSQNANEKTQDDPGFDINHMLKDLTVSTKPMVITAVQRKINIGNYETIDVYVATALPVEVDNMLDQAALQEKLTETVNFGMALASKETADRYKLIKGSL